MRLRPYPAVLFDEIEKAHPDVFNVLLQILDDGRLTDGHGRTVDFKNTVVIMTSNVGTQHIRKQASLGFQLAASERGEREHTQSLIMDEMKRTFRPEFLNRVDEIIIFDPLSKEQIKQIVDLLINQLRSRLREQKVELEITEAAKEWLSKAGFDPMYGARPLRRTIQRQVENQLSKRLLAGVFREGDTVVVDAGPEGLVFEKKEEVVSVAA